jgi:AraC-like DNA-binding protein
MNFIETEKVIKSEEWSMLNLHSHPHYEIYFLQKGTRTFFLSNALYKLEAPVLIIIPPHALHKTEGMAFTRCNVNVAESYLDEFQKHVLDSNTLNVINLSREQATTFSNVLDNMIEVDKKNKYSDYVIKSLFSYLIYSISKLEHNNNAPNTSNSQAVSPLILKIIDYLNYNYMEKTTLLDLSKKFFISKGTLIYNFNKYLGCSPIDYLLNIRLTKAKELLLKNKKSVNEISELCGFSSANYFGLIFKQKEGLSPLAYKKLQQTKS